MDECSGLENRRGCKPTVGSNPTPSATIRGSTRQIARVLVELASSLRKAGLELGLSPRPGLEFVQDRPSALAECLHGRRVTPPPLDAVRDSNHLDLELHSAIVHELVPQAAFPRPFARAVPKPPELTSAARQPFLLLLLRVSLLLDEIP